MPLGKKRGMHLFENSLIMAWRLKANGPFENKENRLNRRDRILTTIAHHEPDRVPIAFDFSSPELEGAVCAHYGSRSLRGLYEKSGIDCFSVWQPQNAVFPVYQGPPRPGVDHTDVNDSTYGFWGKVSEHIYPLERTSLDDFYWPKASDFDYSHLHTDLEAIRQADFPSVSGHAGVGWTHHYQMRSYGNALLDVLDEAWMNDYLARCREFFIPYFENLFKYAGGAIDMIRADEDLGGHDRMLINPNLWRKWYKPLWKEVISICRMNGAKVWLHSCGYCRPVVPDFIEIGADILNPIPPYVRDSDPADMKQTFGKALAFDGGVDQMRVLVAGTPEMVIKEVRLRLRQLAPGGGYILGPSQALTRDIPLENLLALFDTTLAEGWY
jgi:uroporphyrinogen decarboxylase